MIMMITSPYEYYSYFERLITLYELRYGFPFFGLSTIF